MIQHIEIIENDHELKPTNSVTTSGFTSSGGFKTRKAESYPVRILGLLTMEPEFNALNCQLVV